MAKKMKKLFSLILAMSMIMSLLTVGASAAEDGEGETAPANAEQVEYEGGKVTSADGAVSISKTIEGTDDENVFDITLTVETKDTIEEIYKAQDAAVVLVMDISNTMTYKMGARDSEGNGATSTDIRYDASIAAAEQFIKDFRDAGKEAGVDVSRRLGFVAFNTSAETIFTLSECNDNTESKALIKAMKNGTKSILDNYEMSSNGGCIDTDRFTNIEAGLAAAQNMLSAAGESNKYIIFISDGFPTTYSTTEGGTTGYNPYMSATYNPGFVADDDKIGTPGYFYNRKTGELCTIATSYSDMGATRAEKQATIIKNAGTKIYSVGVGIYSDYEIDKLASYVVDCYPKGEAYVIGNTTASFEKWLEDDIGSNSYVNCENAEDMKDAFAEIFEDIEETSLESVAAQWVATDPMNTAGQTAIDFLQFYNKDGVRVNGNLSGSATENGENTASYVQETDAINWDMKHSGYTKVVSGDDTASVTTYKYTLKYRVRLANETAGFVEKTAVDTNGKTTLQYQINTNGVLSDGTLEFPIPEVEGYLAELTFKKTDSAGNGLEGATFTLTHKSDCAVCSTLVNADLQFASPAYTAVSAADGTVTFPAVASGHDYVLQETAAPEGYALNTAKYDVTVAYDALTVKGYEAFESVVNTKLNTLTITKVVDVPAVSGTNVHAEMLTDAVLAGTTYTFDVVGVKNGKTVYDADHSITVAAVTEGEGEAAVTTITGSVELTNLPDGTYTVTEQGEGTYTYGGATYTVAASYENNGIALDDGDEVTINVKNTYTYNPEYVQVNVTKDWQDANNQDGKRPESITYNLLAGEEVIDSKTVTSEDGWAASFIRLPKYENGVEIVYTVTEDEVADYTSSVEEGASTNEASKVFVVTNSHTPEVTSVSGVKTWNDENNADGKRPASITVNLLKNGEEIAEKIVTLRENWSYSWDNLPKYENGQLINYSVSEDPVTDYTASYSGYNITNTYVPGKTDIVAQKVWDDADNQDGIRASSVTVQLKADGEAVGEPVTLNEANGWRYTWSKLNYNKNGGVKIVYTVEEIDVPDGYTASVTEEGYVYTVKNSHTPEVTSVTVNKVWAGSAANMMKPVTMNLYADGELIDSQILDASNQWTYTWTNLAKNKAGVAIAYTVDEEALGDYWYKKVTNEGNVWTIENSYNVPVYTSRTVVKVWDDDNNAAEARPESITVQLIYNGQPFSAPVTLSNANGWTYTWSNLVDVGEWTIAEVDVPEGYTSKVEFSGTTFTVTNTYGEEEIPDENPPMSDWEEFEEEDIPRADVPETGDMTALWAAASVVSAAGVLFLGKKNKDEE